MAVTIAEQIAEVTRELEERAKVYPALVQRGAMEESEAKQRGERLAAVLLTLQWCKRNADRLRG